MTEEQKTDKVDKIEKKFDRICESSWHETTVLKPYEKCPYCNSESYHKVIIQE